MVFSPLYLVVMNWVFFLWDFVVIGLNTFMDLRALDICLAYEYSWWQWGIILIHLICVLALNSWIPEVTLGQSMHRDWCMFSSLFLGRNLGALFEVLCVGLSIMNLKLFYVYRIINSWILVVTLEYLGDISVGWCVSYGVILVWTLG